MGQSGFIKTAINIIIISIVVGFIMSIFGLSPADIWAGAFDTAAWGWDAFAGLLDSSLIYLITGAAIVVPLFAISYFWGKRHNNR
jgi:ABC-type uncharacterized transport system permease subunit